MKDMDSNRSKLIVLFLTVFVIMGLGLVSRRGILQLPGLQSPVTGSVGPLPTGDMQLPQDTALTTPTLSASPSLPATTPVPTPSPVPAVAAPVIFRVTPDRGGVGTEVVITGSGFLPTGNTVVATMEEFTDAPSADGNTLHVILKGPPFLGDLDSQVLDFYSRIKAETEYQVVIRNKNGDSNFIPFIFQFYK